MGFEGKFWLLIEDEPIDVERGRVVELKDGVVLDDRTKEAVGTYSETAEGVDLLFDERDGWQDVVKLRQVANMETVNGEYIRVVPPFDPSADFYSALYSTPKYEAYRAAHPIPENETIDEQFEREDREADEIGDEWTTYGSAFRDGPRVYEIDKRNRADAVGSVH
jgi:hypothetical protein